MCNTCHSNKQCDNDYSNECNTIGNNHINNNNDLFRRKRNLHGNTGQWRNNTTYVWKINGSNGSRSTNSNIYDNNPCKQ